MWHRTKNEENVAAEFSVAPHAVGAASIKNLKIIFPSHIAYSSLYASIPYRDSVTSQSLISDICHVSSWCSEETDYHFNRQSFSLRTLTDAQAQYEPTNANRDVCQPMCIEYILFIHRFHWLYYRFGCLTSGERTCQMVVRAARTRIPHKFHILAVYSSTHRYRQTL